LFPKRVNSLLLKAAEFWVPANYILFSGNILVAADYSQLELRLLAHLSGDITLRDILNSGKDVFRSIAMSWNKISEDEVSLSESKQQFNISCR